MADRFMADCPCIWLHCVWDGGSVLFRWLTAPGGVSELMPGHRWAPRSVFNHYETHAVTPRPWAPSVRKGLMLGQSQRGFHHQGWAQGETGLKALDTSVEYAGTVRGHVRTEMIKVATMRIKSQPHRIGCLNLSTKARLFSVNKKTSTQTPSKNIKCVYTGWGQMLSTDWIHFVVFSIIKAKTEVFTALMDI